MFGGAAAHADTAGLEAKAGDLALDLEFLLVGFAPGVGERILGQRHAPALQPLLQRGFWILEGAGRVERGEGDSLRRERINMMLIGAQPVGTWILASLGLAKETVDDENRALIEDALAALDESLHGDYDPASHFADLTRH